MKEKKDDRRRIILVSAAVVLVCIVGICAAFLQNRWTAYTAVAENASETEFYLDAKSSSAKGSEEETEEETTQSAAEEESLEETAEPETPASTAAPAPESTPAPTPEATAAPTPAPTPAPTTAPAPVAEPSLPVSGAQAAVIVPQGADVGDGYFNDAVFIGDSRTEGFRMHSGVGSTGASFLAKVGMSVDWVCSNDSSRFVNVQGQSMNVISALGLRPYGKIYISLGINETGWMSDQEFAAKYREFLTRIRQIQPNAIIYLQGIIHVTQAHSAQGVNTNKRINEMNSVIMNLASEFQAHYLDLNEVMTDEYGALIASGAASDGVHLNKSLYQVWYQYLRTHAV